MFNLGDTVSVKNEFGSEATGRIIYIDGRERDKIYWVMSQGIEKDALKAKAQQMVLVEKCVPAKEIKRKHLEEVEKARLASLVDSENNNGDGIMTLELKPKSVKPKKSKEK